MESPTLHSLPVIPVQVSKLVFSLPSLDSRIRALGINQQDLGQTPLGGRLHYRLLDSLEKFPFVDEAMLRYHADP